MNCGQTYKIISKEYPVVEFFGTFEFPAYWADETDFDKLVAAFNPHIIKLYKTQYEKICKARKTFEMFKTFKEYMTEQIIHLYDEYNITENDVLFSNITDETFCQYYEDDGLFPNFWRFSAAEFDFAAAAAAEQELHIVFQEKLKIIN